MSKDQRKRAIKILKKYWRQSFFRVPNVYEYIRQVRKRLKAAGIQKVPKKPENFLKFCQKLGLYKKQK